LLTDHGQPLFGAQFNHLLKKGEPLIFATVGSNRVTVYECPDDGSLKIVQSYSDPDVDEIFYTCAWSYDKETGHPVLGVAGLRGVLRVIDVYKKESTKHYIGHGNLLTGKICRLPTYS
jgi:polycomb protein EED